MASKISWYLKLQSCHYFKKSKCLGDRTYGTVRVRTSENFVFQTHIRTRAQIVKIISTLKCQIEAPNDTAPRIAKTERTKRKNKFHKKSKDFKTPLIVTNKTRGHEIQQKYQRFHLHT